jgi:triacylglycerol lipase
MVVRITRILILLQIFAAVVFTYAIETLHVGSMPLAAIYGVGIILALRMLITANNFFIARFYRSNAPDPLHLGWRQGLRLFFNEFKATMLSSSWTMPFHSFSKRCVDEPIGLPVLLIHGYGCNSGYWHALSQALLQARINHYGIDLEPVLSDIDSYVPHVHGAIEAMCEETGSGKIVIVAHSMGGLVARAYLRDHGSTRVEKVITLGTPHRGTGLANFGIGGNSKQMRWTGSAKKGTCSDWLRQLEETETDAIRALFVSIYSHHDNIVSPHTSACLAGAVNIGFNGIGHVRLAFDPAVQARVLDEIRNIRQRPSVGSATQSA